MLKEAKLYRNDDEGLPFVRSELGKALEPITGIFSVLKHARGKEFLNVWKSEFTHDNITDCWFGRTYKDEDGQTKYLIDDGEWFEEIATYDRVYGISDEDWKTVNDGALRVELQYAETEGIGMVIMSPQGLRKLRDSESQAHQDLYRTLTQLADGSIDERFEIRDMVIHKEFVGYEDGDFEKKEFKKVTKPNYYIWNFKTGVDGTFITPQKWHYYDENGNVHWSENDRMWEDNHGRCHQPVELIESLIEYNLLLHIRANNLI